jgi:hypothetical protein
MHFSNSDIIRLYGERFFVLPGHSETVEHAAAEPVAVPALPVVPVAGKTAPPDVSFLQKGAPVDWKMKPQSQIALILTDTEFSDRSKTDTLKQWLIAAKTDLAHVGFGVISSGEKAWDLTTLPVSAAIIWHDLPLPAGTVTEIAGKRIVLAASVASLTDHPQKALSLLQQLQS